VSYCVDSKTEHTKTEHTKTEHTKTEHKSRKLENKKDKKPKKEKGVHPLFHCMKNLKSLLSLSKKIEIDPF
jgi:hypothetical protein